MTLRVEDGPLLRGQGRYLADLSGPRLQRGVRPFVRRARTSPRRRHELGALRSRSRRRADGCRSRACAVARAPDARRHVHPAAPGGGRGPVRRGSAGRRHRGDRGARRRRRGAGGRRRRAASRGATRRRHGTARLGAADRRRGRSDRRGRPRRPRSVREPARRGRADGARRRLAVPRRRHGVVTCGHRPSACTTCAMPSPRASASTTSARAGPRTEGGRRVRRQVRACGRGRRGGCARTPASGSP